MLHGDHGEFWLEPVAVSLEEKRGTSPADGATSGELGAGARTSVYEGPTAGRPHLVFRRSAEQQQQQLEIGAGGRSKRRRKKKRKQERNCGTRGENRPRHLFLVLLSPFARAPCNRGASPRAHRRRPTPLALSPSLVICIACIYVSAVYNVIGRAVVWNVGVSSTPRLSFIFRRR